VQPVSEDKRGLDSFKTRLKDFDKLVQDFLNRGDTHVPDGGISWKADRVYAAIDGDIDPVEQESTMPEADVYTEESFDKYLSAEVVLALGDGKQRAKVTGRKRDTDGNPVGVANSNPILDTRVYTVEFPDGTEKEYSANIIAESLYSEVDQDGRQFQLIDEIIDHSSDASAVSRDDMYVDKDGPNRHLRRTTKGWKLLIQWKDGTSTWERLANLKESNPVQVAEYAVANKLAEEPAFIWWIKDVLRRRDRIISKVKARYWKRTHKFGIRVPKSVKEALEIDAEMGTNFWKRAIEKEMANVMPAFKFLEGDENLPVGCQKIDCHIIFDVKLDLTRKARYVAGGHMTEAPAALTYSSVVSRESVRIAFMAAALNGLDILAADAQNAYLNADCRESVYTIAGPEFGAARQGLRVLIVQALYGLKSSGAAWHAHLAQTMSDLKFRPCVADPDVWLRPAVKGNGDKYYEYVLIYVHDILAVSEKPAWIMETLSGLYKFKEDPKTRKKYGPPDRYLGANVGKYKLPGATKEHWYMSSDNYVKAAVTNVENELFKVGQRFTMRLGHTVMSQSYRPELDVSPVLGADKANHYQNLIGILRWAVELGRIDIFAQVSMLSQYLAQPREGHLDQVFHIFGYLKVHGRSKVVFDDTFISWKDKFTQCDWQDFYPDAKEPIPGNMPEPRGKEVQLNAFVDADHAGNQVTRRSRTGVLIFVNKAPVIWFSKRQNTVETSTFGSEFVAMKIATELLIGLRYKLRMMGLPLDGPANVFGDNQSVVTNASRSESVLKKKHVSICYHRVREACAADIIRIAHESTKTNLADLLTKNYDGHRIQELVSRILY
jgi:hypothetical protein